MPTADDAPERFAPLREAIDRATSLVTDTAFLASGGELDVAADVDDVRSLLIEVPDNQFLHLQSVGLETHDGTDARAGATVSVSSWYGTYQARFTSERLFDFDHPSGTVVHTERGDPAWMEIRFPSPMHLARVRLRNVANNTATRAARLRVSARTQARTHLLHDGGTQESRLEEVLSAIDQPGTDPVVRRLVPVLRDTLRGAYPAARKTFKGMTDLEDTDRAEFRRVVNADLLPSRNRLWTAHGPCRAFRFWTPEEQIAYVEFAREVAETLSELTPHVSFGFGAVLSVVRDHALIPHDDDLDLIIGFEPEEATTLAEGLELVSSFLIDRDLAVRGTYTAHRQVGRTARSKHLDVFVGLFEGDAISWYPGTRGSLDRATMYPPTFAPLLGIDCPIPAKPETYLATLYGPTWNTPDPNFTHRWDRSAYADLAGKKVETPARGAHSGALADGAPAGPTTTPDGHGAGPGPRPHVSAPSLPVTEPSQGSRPVPGVGRRQPLPLAPLPAADLASSQRAQWDLLRDYVVSYAERQPVRKVTVVGNAPLEPDPDRVAEIDGSDVVIRINSLALDEPGGPPCVGTRCHVAVMSRYARVTPWSFRDYKRRAYLIPQAGFGKRYNLLPQPNFWPADLGTLPIPNAPVVAELMGLLDPAHKPNRLFPTSGTLACYLAHEMFPDADLVATGLSFLDGLPQPAWNYQSGGGSAVIPAHHLDLEAALLKSWIADGSLRVHP